jgi:hypothetical protein
MMASEWGMTPRQSIEGECARGGTRHVVAHCVDILSGDDVDEAMLMVLAGPGAATVLRGGAGGVTGYWPRVWALRGLLYAWDEGAVTVVRDSVNNESWRVREMCAKVVARHRVDDALEAMVGLIKDPVLRVRQAAHRALVRLAEADT